MKTAIRVVLLAVLATASCGTEEGAPGDGAGADAGDADAIDSTDGGDGSDCLNVVTIGPGENVAAAEALAGTWAQLHVVSHMGNYPGYSAVHTLSEMWQLVRAEADAQGTLALTERMCRLLVETPDLGVDTIISDAFIASLDPTVRHVAPASADPGSPFASDTVIEVRGAHLEDLACEELPYVPEDPRVYDQDGDGHPGVSLDITGLVNVQVYVVQRWSSTFTDGTIESLDRISGRVVSTNEQQTLDATNLIFDPEDPDPEEFGSWPDPDPTHSYFEMVRLPDGATCEDVLAAGLTPR